MDGLSAGASVMAVISLAAQLGAGAHTVIKFLNTVSDTPAEIQRLKSLLDQIYAIATCVRNALEYQRKLHGDKRILADDIHISLLNCQKKVQGIEHIVDRFKETEKGRSVASRKWASLKLALKKEDVLGLERQLGLAIQILDISLTTYSLASQTRNTLLLIHKLDSLPSTDNQLAVVGSGSNLTLNSARRHAPVENDRDAVYYSRHKFTRTHESQWSAHNFGFCRIGITKSKTTDCRYYRESPSQSIKEKTKYDIYPSFLSRAITLTISNLGITNVSLKIVPFMSYDMVSRLTTCGLNDDLAGIQSLLSNKEISIHSKSLFLDAVNCAWKSPSNDGKEILMFLIHQGCELNESDLQGMLDLIMPWIRPHQIDSFFQIFKVLCSRIEYAENPVDELFKISEAFHDVKIFEILEWLAFTGVQITTLPPDFYLGSVLSVLVRSWNSPMTNENLIIHRALVKKLVTAGADLHYRDSDQRTLLQRLVACSPVQNTHEEYINEWLSVLEDCTIDVRDYLLQESHFPDLHPFEIDTYATFRAAQKTDVSIFLYQEMYTCIDLCVIGLRFDNLGHPIPELLRWVDPGSPAALVLEEYSFCANLILIPGEHCNCLAHWIPSWKRNLQDLRDVPIDAPRMLTYLGWDVDASQAGRSILPSGQVKVLLVDNELFGPLDIFLQNLAMKPEITISRCAARAQQEWDEGLEGVAQVNESTRAPVKTEYASTKATELCQQGNCQYFTFCDCDASGIYLDLWPFHGSTHTLCQTGNKLNQACLGSAGPYAFGERWCEIHRCRFNHARFERKQAKKVAKRLKREGKKVAEFHMPGAWPS